MKKTILSIAILGAAAILFTGCGGAKFSKVGTTMSGEKVTITKKDVHAKTKMSETVFLEPVAPEDQIIYFRFRNTSDEELDINQKLKEAFEKKGFKVTRNPKEANFLVQANLLKIGEMDQNEQKNYLGAGFGTGLALASATALTGGYGSDSGKMAVAGALLGMAIESAKVKDVHFAMVTDVEIRQRPLEGETVSQEENMQGNMGANASVKQKSTNANVKWKKYRTRIVSSAYAAGLEFKQAKPFLEDGLIKALSGTM